MAKYEPLRHFLADRRSTEIPMTFDDIEHLIQGRLPATAFSHRAWWSNNPTNNVMTRAWLDAGYKTERVDMEGRKLVFVRKAHEKTPVDNPPSEAKSSTASPRGFLARMRETLGGTVRIPPGVDLTEPVGEKWDAER